MMAISMRFLLLLCLVFPTASGFASPEDPAPRKSCARKLAEWAGTNWKWLAGAGVVLIAGYGIYETVRPPDTAQLGQAEPQPEKTDTLDAWRKRHAGSSPFLAFNRKSDWKIERSAVEAVDSGKPTELSFDTPFWHAGKSYKEVELTDALEFTGVEKADARGFSEFDRQRVEAIADYVKQSKPTELVVVHVNARHAFDYFLRHPGQSTSYAISPWNSARKTANEAYDEYRRLSGAPNELPEIRQVGLAVYLEKILRLADFKTANPAFDLGMAFDEREPKGNVIVIGSFPRTRDTSVFDELPSPESLREAGFTSVTILVDGLPSRSQPYSFDEVRDAVDFLKTTQRDAAGQDFLFRLKGTHPAAFDLIMSGKVQTDPGRLSLVNRARTWNSALPTRIYSVGK